ncbi:MAG: YggT family protein [Desulfosporosinus sp.]|jgi:hypothetical protein
MERQERQNSFVLSQDKLYINAKSIIYYILGVIEILLIFRFIFKLLAANPESGFVSLIYAITNIFLVPFAGIFKTAATPLNGMQSILEPATLIGIVVYLVLAWGIIKLIEVIRINQLEKI